MIEVGRVCLKTAGREAGKYCVVVKKMDENGFKIEKMGPEASTELVKKKMAEYKVLVEEMGLKKK